MQNLFLRLLFGVFVLMGMLRPPSVFAGHIYGGQMSVECQNPCTSRVHLTFYRDCVAILFTYPLVEEDTLTGSCPLPTPLQAWSPIHVVSVTPSCPGGWNSGCNTLPGNTVFGVEEWSLYRDYDICGPAAGCTFSYSWSVCCRNNAITSLPSPYSFDTYLFTEMNTSLAACNSSPQWNEHPVAVLCLGQKFVSDQGAVDPDGDSLVYRLGDCLDTLNSPVTYLPGYSATEPLGASWEISLDPGSGVLSFEPNPGNIGVGVICIYVDEYRNGQRIATSIRDILVATSNCPVGNTAPVLTGISNLMGSGVSLNGDTLEVCSGDTFSFEVAGSDPDSDPLILSWNRSVPGGSFYETGNPAITDTVGGLNPRATFTFSGASPGVYPLIIFVGDTFCPNPDFDLLDLTLLVRGDCGYANGVVVGCLEVEFVAGAQGGTGNYSYVWSGQGGLSSSLDSLVFSYPGPGTYSWQCIISDGAFIQDTVVGSVTLPGPVYTPLISGSGNIDPCGSGLAVLAAGSGYSSYSWSNGMNTSVITVSTPGTYGLTVSDPSGCSFFDSLVVGIDSPDISGIIQSSAASPLPNQRVYLIKYDTFLQSLTAVDTTQTDVNGYYQFCSVSDSFVFVKAAPDSLSFPFEMPTYADTALFWNNARILSMAGLPYRVDFATRFGQNPGGSGFIGGLISQGANKSAGIGDPVAGISVFLIHELTGLPVGYRVTDAQGYFAFGNLPVGQFRVAVDVPGVDVVQVPVIPLNSGLLVRDSLDFRLHSSYLEWVLPTYVGEEARASFSAFPNPGGDKIYLAFYNTQKQGVDIQLFDPLGKGVKTLWKGVLNAGDQRVVVSPKAMGLKQGIYFARLRMGATEEVLRLVIMD